MSVGPNFVKLMFFKFNKLFGEMHVDLTNFTIDIKCFSVWSSQTADASGVSHIDIGSWKRCSQ